MALTTDSATSGSQLGRWPRPSSCMRRCTCMIEAPALKASRASAAICAGVTGTGCCFGLVSTPVSAQVRMALSTSLSVMRQPRAASSSSTSSAPEATCWPACTTHAHDAAGGTGGDPHLHLHRLDADQRLAGGDRVARLHRELGDDAGHRRLRAARIGAPVGLRHRRRLARRRRRAPRAPGAAPRPATAPRRGARRRPTRSAARGRRRASRRTAVRRAVERDLHGCRRAAGARAACGAALPAPAAGRRRRRCRGAAPRPRAARKRPRRGTSPRRSATGRCTSGAPSRCQSSSSCVVIVAAAEGGMVEQVAQEARVVAQAEQRRVRERGAQAADRVGAVAAVGDHLGDHRVVERARPRCLRRGHGRCARPAAAPPRAASGAPCRSAARSRRTDPRRTGAPRWRGPASPPAPATAAAARRRRRAAATRRGRAR